MPLRLLNSILVTFIALTATLLQGCTGGNCKYDEIEGICEVTGWEGTGAVDDGEPSDRFDVRFDFIPNGSSDATVTDSYLSVGSDLACRAWLDEVGLIEESQHDCVLMEATRGTCSPMVFRFNDIDETSVYDACPD